MAVAYERLQGLGEVKFRKILNELMRGLSPFAMARVIKREWGDFGDVAEQTLGVQLTRLRKAAAEGMFGDKIAANITKGSGTGIKSLDGISISALDRLEELAGVQRARVFMLVEEERIRFAKEKEIGTAKHPVPMGKVVEKSAIVQVTTTNAVINDYSQMLQDLQKMRFDMGLDEFAGPVSGVRGAATKTEFPDGTVKHTQVFEALETLEQVFARRKTPVVTSMPPGH